MPGLDPEEQPTFRGTVSFVAAARVTSSAPTKNIDIDHQRAQDETAGNRRKMSETSMRWLSSIKIVWRCVTKKLRHFHCVHTEWLEDAWRCLKMLWGFLLVADTPLRPNPAAEMASNSIRRRPWCRLPASSSESTSGRKLSKEARGLKKNHGAPSSYIKTCGRSSPVKTSYPEWRTHPHPGCRLL